MTLFVLLSISLVLNFSLVSKYEQKVDIDSDIDITTNEFLICEDECTFDHCNKREYFTCEMSAAECKYRVSQGKIRGRCGVECFKKSECGSSNKVCIDYKCEVRSKKIKVPLIFTVNYLN